MALHMPVMSLQVEEAQLFIPLLSPSNGGAWGSERNSNMPRDDCFQDRQTDIQNSKMIILVFPENVSKVNFYPTLHLATQFSKQVYHL